MSTPNNTHHIAVTSEIQRRRRWSPEQKVDLVKQTFERGMTVSRVARQAGIAPAQLFQWKKAYQQGLFVAVSVNDTDKPSTDLEEAFKLIKQLEAALGRKTLENEILKEEIEVGKFRQWLARSPQCPE